MSGSGRGRQAKAVPLHSAQYHFKDHIIRLGAVTPATRLLGIGSLPQSIPCRLNLIFRWASTGPCTIARWQ
jgi:hypothetical protein